MSSDIVYRANCNCGRYRYELTLPTSIATVIACNCSLCTKQGYLWTIFPRNGIRTIRDDGHLKEYTSQVLSHKYCNICGNGVTGEHLTGPLKGQTLLNVRLFQEVNPFKLESQIERVDTDESYQKHELTTSEAPAAAHLFSCHCGKLRAELLTPIHDQEIKEDNCSSCVRVAYIGIYPTRDQVRLHGLDNGWEYFGLRAEINGRKWGSVVHCKTCGVFVLNKIYGPPISIFDKLAPERKVVALEAYHKNINLLPLNVRTVEGFAELYSTLSIKRSDEGTDGYAELLEPWNEASS